MNAHLIQKVRHGLLVLALATLVALATTALPTLLDQAAGTALTPHVYACQAPIGGC